jgi:hypothetical protein
MPALALANSAQWFGHAVIMSVFTYRAVGGLSGLGGTIGRTLLASAALAVVLLMLERFLGMNDREEQVTLGLQLGLSIVLGGTAYVGSLALVGREELGLLISALRRRGRG